MNELVKKNPLGKTGVNLSEISFGASSLGGLYRAVSDQEAHDVLQCVWDEGIRYIDTAPFYGFGLSEKRVGDFLAGKEKCECVLSTKAGRVLEPVDVEDIPDFGFVAPLPNRPVFDYSYDGILRSFQSSQERLSGSSIDILYIHDIGELTHGVEVNEKHYRDLLKGGFKALEELRSSGQVKAVGLGVNEVDICLKTMQDFDIDTVLLAGRYTLLDRTAEKGFLQACENKGIHLVIGGVFNSGILATGAVPGAFFDYEEAPEYIRRKVQLLEEACNDLNVSLAEAALQFPLRHKAVSSVLVGTGKVSSLKRSMDAMGTRIPEELWKLCDEIARSEDT